MSPRCYLAALLAVLLVAETAANDGLLSIDVDGQALVSYQAKPLVNPEGGKHFNGSNFIHPLKTPSGFVVTDLQPSDHRHHFGLWWPWKFVEVEGRKILCWELQQRDGIVRAVESRVTEKGFFALSEYLDRKAPEGPRRLLTEQLDVSVVRDFNDTVDGYLLNLGIVQAPTVDTPVTVFNYRYSGFSLRGTPFWNKENSTVLTSEGLSYDKADGSRARWVRIQGLTDTGSTAGILLMTHPNNFDYPELLRTWNSKRRNGAIFVNMNSVQERSWVLEPQKEYRRNYGVFVYDGSLSADAAEAVWTAYERQATLAN
ncbi:MAG: PmoA family protein [Opitutales bacterium]